jgi:hypothetical protein
VTLSSPVFAQMAVSFCCAASEAEEQNNSGNSSQFLHIDFI